jgi:hypothetical protein
VWDAGARPDSITLDIDATLLTAHSDKDRATGNHKHGYGFHPIGCWLAESGEALAAVLRPGNAGSNTAEDHFEVLGLALAQIPAADLDRNILVGTDVGGATHAFTTDCRDAGIRFSVGYPIDQQARDAILQVPQNPVGSRLSTATDRTVTGRGSPRSGACSTCPRGQRDRS